MGFQTYYDVEKEVLIESASAEATANCWAQEINLVECRKVIEEDYKRNHPVKYWFKQFFKKLRGGR